MNPWSKRKRLAYILLDPEYRRLWLRKEWQHLRVLYFTLCVYIALSRVWYWNRRLINALKSTHPTSKES